MSLKVLIYCSENETTPDSGSGYTAEAEENDTSPPEVMLAIHGNRPHLIKTIYEKGDARSNNKPMPTLSSIYANVTQNPIADAEQPAYLAKLGGAVNITCFSPEKHFWCSSTPNFARSAGQLHGSSCITTLIDNTSSNIDLVYHRALDDARKIMQLPEDLKMRNVSVSTLLLKNLSVDDVGSYECFTFSAKGGMSNKLEVLYQTIYIYLDGGTKNLSVPIDHLNHDKIESKSGEIIVIPGKLGKNIVLPCRPLYPSITVDLFKQVLRPKQKLVDPIEDLLKFKVSTSKFYQDHITPLFYYHPRIGFVLDSARKEDQGLYHCRFTSTYKYEEIKTFKVRFRKEGVNGLKPTAVPNENTSSNDTNNESLGYRNSHSIFDVANVLCWLSILQSNLL